MIVPFAPGGASDFVARILAPRLQAAAGPAILIDNRAGAAGNIGMELAARRLRRTATPPSSATSARWRSTRRSSARASASPRADLRPVSLVANAPDIIVAHPSVPANTAAEFVEYARKTPGMGFASPGPAAA